MESFNIYKNLALLNELPEEEAVAAYYNCSGSSAWARQMAAARPFRMIEELYRSADRIWYSLPSSDRLESFSPSKEPDIPRSDRKDLAPNNSQAIAANPVEDGIQLQFEEAARLYEDKFGFIFILSPDDRSSAEILSICRARFGNSAETELRIAVEEQRKIIETRLNRLLEI